MSTTGESSKRPEVGSNSLLARTTIGVLEAFCCAPNEAADASEAISSSFALTCQSGECPLGSRNRNPRHDLVRQATPPKSCMSRVFRFTYPLYTHVDLALIVPRRRCSPRSTFQEFLLQ